MPHRSRKVHNWISLIGGAFAFLLIISAFFVPDRQSLQPISIRTKNSNSPAAVSEGLVAGVAQDNATGDKNVPLSEKISVDVSNWKSYRDPIYHFEIKYPSEWAAPIAKKMSDPDFDYEYQVSFGTAETMAGAGIEGFTIYVFRTEKCSTNPSSNVSSCATQTSKIPTDTISSEKIFEISSKTYSYTIVPFIPESGTDPNLAKKVDLELIEAQKSFVIDSNLPILTQSQKPTQLQPPVVAPVKKNVPAGNGRAGKLTGAKASGGKLVCPHPNRKPVRSPNKGNHVDEDCCPDPDEYPNRACAYKPSDYAIMLKP